MPDSFSPDIRSRIMRKIRSKDTTPEKTVRSFLHAKGFRFRINQVKLPGRPDIVLRKYNTVVFVHGCFWHQHPSKKCPHTGFPLSNLSYWKPKLDRTVERDRLHSAKLKKEGWKVEVVWECELCEERLHRLIASIVNKKPERPE